MPKLFDLVRLQGSQTGTLNGAVTFTNGSSDIGRTAHGFVENQPIRLTTSGSLPTNFAVATTYFVIAAGLTADVFRLSATMGGGAITAGSAGSGTHTAQGGLKVDVAVSGWLTFTGGGAVSGEDVTFAINDTSHNLIGEGVYYTNDWLSIVTIIKSSNSNAMISLSGTQQIGVTPGIRHFIDKGTKMLFVQTAAPTGWTKDTDQNDKALRIVSGSASTGGSSAFSTVFGKTATDGTTLAAGTVPSVTVAGSIQFYTYSYSGTVSAAIPGLDPISHDGGYSDSDLFTGGTILSAVTGGSGGSHTHPMDIRVQYVDVIKATKD